MPTRVVEESHTINDDYVEVPSIKDFEQLKSQLDTLESRVSKKLDKDSYKYNTNRIIEDIEQLISFKDDIKSNILTILSDNNWNEKFIDQLEGIIDSFDERYDAVNDILNSKIHLISKIDLIEESINNLMIKYEEEINAVIMNKGNEMLDTIIDNNNKTIKEYITQLNNEAKNIKW